MNNKEKSKIILRILNKAYPKVPIPLNYKNTFTLLVSVLLSAQCTDVNVNNVTKKIYPKYNKPQHFVKLGRKKIESLIRRIGIFRVKAKSIFYLSKTLVEKYNGKVPRTYEELEKLIKRIGIFRVKAKSIFYLSKTLVEKFKGRVPKTYEELEELIQEE